MKRTFLAVALSAGMSFLAAGAFASESAHPHWSYEGSTGPAHWGHISEEYATCMKGQNQSPIDISGAQDEDLKDIEFKYNPVKVTVVNNGHTIQANTDKGSSIMVDGAEYQLLQYHFHGPSEHTVAGKSYPAELHLVHKNDKGELAVVGVMIEEAGKDNAAYKAIIANMPKKEGEKKEVKVQVNPADLLPRSKAYFKYTGSLTTPPCSENVKWHVLKESVQVSKAQLDKYRALYKGNNRPVQPLNTRKVSLDKTTK